MRVIPASAPAGSLAAQVISEFVGVTGSAAQRGPAVVEFVVAAPAQQCEVVDVGASAVRRLPRDDVVGFAPARRHGAQDAVAIASDEGAPLGVGNGAHAASVPEWLAVAIEDDPEDVRAAGEPFEFAPRDRPNARNLAPCPLIATDCCGIGDDDDLVPSLEALHAGVVRIPGHRDHALGRIVGKVFASQRRAI